MALRHLPDLLALVPLFAQKVTAGVATPTKGDGNSRNAGVLYGWPSVATPRVPLFVQSHFEAFEGLCLKSQ